MVVIYKIIFILRLGRSLPTFKIISDSDLRLLRYRMHKSLRVGGGGDDSSYQSDEHIHAPRRYIINDI